MSKGRDGQASTAGGRDSDAGATPAQQRRDAGRPNRGLIQTEDLGEQLLALLLGVLAHLAERVALGGQLLLGPLPGRCQ